jgi:ABC-type nitrate/sulfonate/bicarbonate transport system ATPase subunit
MQTKLEAPVKVPLSFAQAGVTLSGVGRTYRSRKRHVVALEGLDLSVAEREVVAVVGPSGCGKSTLLELAAGLQEPDAGSVTAAGAADAAGRRAACSYMPQRDLLLPWRTILDNTILRPGGSRTPAGRGPPPGVGVVPRLRAGRVRAAPAG